MSISMKQKQSQGYREETCGCQGEGMGGRMKQAGINSCEVLYIEQINDKVLLYSTENYIMIILWQTIMEKNRGYVIFRQEPAVSPFAWQSDKAILLSFIQKRNIKKECVRVCVCVCITESLLYSRN